MRGADRIIGRTSELEKLGAFVDAVADGPTGLILEGEPGAGKTTLFRAGVSAARDRGTRVLVASTAQAEARLGLAGIADLLDGVLDGVLPRLPAPQADALRVALLLERPGRAAADDRAVATAVRSAIRMLAADAPLIVAVDDVQWLDAASAGVLAFVWRRLRREPVGLLVTRRTGEDSAAWPIRDDVPVTRLSVAGLSLGAVRGLLESRLGLVLSRPALRRVHEVAGGNPFTPWSWDARGSGATWRRRRVCRCRCRIRCARWCATGSRRSRQRRVMRLGWWRHCRCRRSGFSRARSAARSSRRRSHPTCCWSTARGSASLIHCSPLWSTNDSTRSRVGNCTGSWPSWSTGRSGAPSRPLGRRAGSRDRGGARACEPASGGRGASAAAAELCEQSRTLTPPSEADDRHRRTVGAANLRFAAGETARARALLDEALAGARTGPPRAR